MSATRHIVVIRFSAMGDVAMTVPVIQQVLQQNPWIEITVVSNAFLQPLFRGLERCHFYPAQLHQNHKGLKGLYRLYKELKTLQQFDAIADLHSVLRSQILTTFFKLSGYKVATIDKGRQQKKLLTQKEHKQLQQLPTSFERYAAVFRKLGLECHLKTNSPVFTKQPLPPAAVQLFSTNQSVIGVAPFAQHTEKMYPLQKMKAVVKTLSLQGYTVLLLGGGKKEAMQLQDWQQELQGSVINIAGLFSFEEELAIISNLSGMVSMDSANMHLASLYGISVISIWGATHPFAGFYGWGQPAENIVSIDIFCRPCSVFGNKPCWRGDHACMRDIEEAVVVKKINTQL